MKISSDKKFAFFERSLTTGSPWIEILNLTKITAVQEHRICTHKYSNDSGKLHGYKVYAEGGPQDGFWINDAELNELINVGIFGKVEK